MLRRLEDIRADDPGAVAAVGGKALGLARLAAAGLKVPETRVLPVAARAADADPLAEALDAAWAALLPLAPGGALVVRSSASSEDRAGGAAPGLYASITGVRTRAALADAVHAVWASLEGEIARAYLARRGLAAAGAGMAVVLQPELPGRAITVYTRRPEEPDALVLELEGTPALLARAAPHAPLTPLPGGLDATGAAAVARAALAAEAAIDAGASGADVELVLDDHGEVWLVQARPIVAAPAARAPAPRAYDFSAREPDVLWRWDAAHNPEPLSPAQASLVALVDAAGAAPYRQRVVDGYLYYAARAGTPPPPAPLSAEALRRRYEASWRPALEAALARAEATPVPPLAAVLAAYVDFYAAYAALAAPLRAAREALVAALVPTAGPRAPRVAAALLGAIPAAAPARLPLAWDVAAGEVALGGAGHAAARPAASPAAPPPEDLGVPPGVLDAARAAAAIGEEDDAAFARAQAAVRRAIAALAARWQVAEDDLLHLPVDELARADGPPADLGARAAAARAERAARRGMVPPFAIAAGRALPALGGAPAAVEAGLLRGVGSGGRARGRVHRLATSAAPSAQAAEMLAPRGSVVVAATVLPGMALLVDGAVAIVAEHGGPLGHGAALARELGLPCVVGASGATELLGDGDEVLVDGAAGLVWRLGGPG